VSTVASSEGELGRQVSAAVPPKRVALVAGAEAALNAMLAAWARTQWEVQRVRYLSCVGGKDPGLTSSNQMLQKQRVTAIKLRKNRFRKL
jgi:hypothetical protein